MLIKEALQWSSKLQSDSPRLDAELLLCHVIQKSRTYLFTWPDRHLDDEQVRAYAQLISRREAGEPIAHILGEKEFWSLSFKVNNATLIPRPDTELLVEQALEYLSQRDLQSAKVLDLGTGTGAVALAIAHSCQLAQVVGVDQSQAAVDLAEHNCQTLDLRNAQFLVSNWFEQVQQSFDLIVANPPYIDEQDPHLNLGDVRFEPRSALVAGKQGLEDLEVIIEQAPEYLVSKGALYLEHGWQQAEDVQVLMKARGFEQVQSWVDLGGNLRITGGRWLG